MFLGPLLVTALAVGANPIVAASPAGPSDPSRVASPAGVHVSAAVGNEANDAAELEEAGVRIIETASAELEAAEQAGLHFAATSLPTQALVGIFNPANSHLNRSTFGARSDMASAAWTDPGGQWWQPSVFYALTQDRSPVVSGFGATLPQAAELRSTLINQTVATQWTTSAWQLGLRATRSVERSAELGVFAPLSLSTGRAAFVTWQPIESLELQLDQAEDRIRGLADGSRAVWRSQTFSAQWNMGGGLSLGSSYYRGRSLAGDAMPAMTTEVANLSLDYSFGAVEAQAEGNDARAYLRLERQKLGGEGIVFAADTPATSWSASIGIAMPF